MKFLIIRLSSLGDIIHSLPLVYKLRENYPDSRIDWLVGKSGFEILKLIKELDNIYLPDIKSILDIQKQKYDYVIDVQGLLKSSVLSKLSFGRQVIGFKNTRELADVFYDIKVDAGNLFKTNHHIVDLNLRLISDLIKNSNNKIKFLIPEINEQETPEVLNILQTFKTKNHKLQIIVFPATTWESKLWPVNYWFELIDKLSKDSQIYICASNSDLKYIKPLVTKLDSVGVTYNNLIGKTSIKDLIFLIQNVNLVIGSDSFGIHLASAIKNDFGSPNIIGIYGPTSLVRNGPYNSTRDCFYLSELECIACRKKKCPLGHHNCMNNIIPSHISEKIMLNSYHGCF